MSARLRLAALPVAVVSACLAFAGSAAAATTSSFSGTVANGGCATARTVPVSGASRIEVSVSSTAQNNTNVFADIVAPDGRVVAGGGSGARYDTPGGGTYSIRVCAAYEAQSPPNLQYSGLLGTGPAGQPILVGPPQPQPQAGTGAVLGVRTTIGPLVSGKAAIRTRAGLAWFTLATARNATMTLRVVDPIHHLSRVVKGLNATRSGNTVRITGHGVVLVLNKGTRHERVTFRSSRFDASGRVVRGGIRIVA
jgi:hypothetical protein